MASRNTFRRELEVLQRDLLKMGTMVEASIFTAVKSLKEGDAQAAQAIVDGDASIDALEVDIERRSLQLLALQQPMASDLRLIGTTLKIITDLERIADHAADIAKVTLRLAGQPLIKPLVDIPRMADISQQMVAEGLQAFIERDPERAERMALRDEEVDHLYNQIFRELLVIMLEDPRTVRQATYLLFVAMYLERVADHATNLAEWVIYMVTGDRRELND
ncbi:MAG: phosphate signaling complex protein PhoU [Bacillota bacterium]